MAASSFITSFSSKRGICFQSLLVNSGCLFSTLSSLVSFREDEEDDTGDLSYLKKFP